MCGEAPEQPSGPASTTASQPTTWPPPRRRLAEAFAQYAGVTVANASTYHRSAALVEQLQEALTGRAVIDQAKGVLMERHGATAAKAFTMLVNASLRTNRKLRDIAVANRQANTSPNLTRRCRRGEALRNGHRARHLIRQQRSTATTPPVVVWCFSGRRGPARSTVLRQPLQGGQGLTTPHNTARHRKTLGGLRTLGSLIRSLSAGGAAVQNALIRQGSDRRCMTAALTATRWRCSRPVSHALSQIPP